MLNYNKRFAMHRHELALYNRVFMAQAARFDARYQAKVQAEYQWAKWRAQAERQAAQLAAVGTGAGRGGNAAAVRPRRVAKPAEGEAEPAVQTRESAHATFATGPQAQLDTLIEAVRELQDSSKASQGHQAPRGGRQQQRGRPARGGRSQQQRQERKPLTCWLCGQPDHIVRDCPHKGRLLPQQAAAVQPAATAAIPQNQGNETGRL